MPYMYCNHTGCNETVKLPSKYCAKHTKQPTKQEQPKTKAKKTTII